MTSPNTVLAALAKAFRKKKIGDMRIGKGEIKLWYINTLEYGVAIIKNKEDPQQIDMISRIYC